MPLYSTGSPALAVLRSHVLALLKHAPAPTIAAVGLEIIEGKGDAREITYDVGSKPVFSSVIL